MREFRPPFGIKLYVPEVVLYIIIPKLKSVNCESIPSLIKEWQKQGILSRDVRKRLQITAEWDLKEPEWECKFSRECGFNEYRVYYNRRKRKYYLVYIRLEREYPGVYHPGAYMAYVAGMYLIKPKYH